MDIAADFRFLKLESCRIYCALSRQYTYADSGNSFMNTNVQTELKIPDLWFDFYARFLPGAAFVASLYFLRGGQSVPAGLHVALLALAGYVCGLVIQPASSEITELLECWVAKIRTGDPFYVFRVAESDPRMILPKMHGETTFFVQSSVLAAILFSMQLVPAFFGFDCSRTWPKVTLAVALGLFLGGVEVACRRVRRARRIKELGGSW